MIDPSEMNILAIDTSTRKLKLALRFGGDRLIKSQEVVNHSHGRSILRKIDGLLDSGALSRDQIQGLVLSTGPGSFTGIRIGLAVAKGMAVGLSIPMVGVSLLDLAADRFRDSSEAVTVLVPFRRDEFVASTVEHGACDPGRIRIVRTEEIPEMRQGERVVVIGFDANVQFSQVGKLPTIETLEFDAADLLHAGAARIANGQIPALEELEPLYLGKSQAEIRFEQSQKDR